jgi:hypothetical protein
VLPLEKTIERFGTATVTPVTFSLVGFSVGGGAVAPAKESLNDDFAPGQFEALTDDQKLARPAFESMPSGGRIDVAEFAVPGDARTGVAAQIGYEDAIVDVEPVSGTRTANPPEEAISQAFPAQLLKKLIQGSAAAFAETRSNGSDEFAGPDQSIVVRGERFVVAGADTLEKASDSPKNGFSSAQANDRLKGASTKTSMQVALVHEVT